DRTVDSDADATTGITATVSITAPNRVTSVDAGAVAATSLTSNQGGTADAAGTSFVNHFVDVTAVGPIQATLDWSTASARLNLYLKDPTGATVAQLTSSTAKPQFLQYQATMKGRWTIGVKAVTGATSYTLAIFHSPGGSASSALASYSTSFGYMG